MSDNGTPEELEIEGRSGTSSHFFWKQSDKESDEDAWLFRLSEREDLAFGFAELRIVSLNGRMWQIDVINKPKTAPWVRGKPITQTLLAKAAEVTGGTIFSSLAERRSLDAEGMWSRMETEGLATFDPDSGRWKFTGDLASVGTTPKA